MKTIRNNAFSKKISEIIVTKCHEILLTIPTCDFITKIIYSKTCEFQLAFHFPRKTDFDHILDDKIQFFAFPIFSRYQAQNWFNRECGGLAIREG